MARIPHRARQGRVRDREEARASREGQAYAEAIVSVGALMLWMVAFFFACYLFGELAFR